MSRSRGGMRTRRRLRRRRTRERVHDSQRRVTKVDIKVRMIDIEMISFMKAAFGIPHLEENRVLYFRQMRGTRGGQGQG